ncbi:bifunctional 5,10-methylenetetrahydrofolate dehydrogenase/5,10-methenyltetrahydrofolate cyclohydrolase [Enterococcus timonensis]|uniref:bifunctional 5,10-methylenetetrahydrofolate dehydrogenase/5,10-methenyltetrahydrofolate cyclohydrolase n=1 Tax=Enterococcus timonensis TaxID=1852364 RepID=UPI0008D92C70|nr:bifunctional 5,10-methylenetetrahydrofolate dehydrogenase/5,10-methenyltetrahydrofolate cyclohydrolase [Enterococcus timonensis]
MGEILDGRALADQLQIKLKEEVEQLPFSPKLVVILVGDDGASEIYVRNKKRAAEKVGIISVVENLPKETSEAELLALINRYNEDPETDGLIVQLPLPAHLNEEKIISAVDPAKDVDGFHPENAGLLLTGKNQLVPSTPLGIMTLLNHYGISVAGKIATVVGRSNIVGKPMAQLLLQNDATVIMTHSKTKNLAEMTKLADILIVAIGRGQFITADYVKEGAVVVDVGMNRNAEGKLVGDVDFKQVEPLASFITPVPKGVGPMTITSLLQQTVKAAKIRRGIS